MTTQLQTLVSAFGTLTSDATNVSNNDTVVIGGQTYTFKTALTASTTANEVLIGASASASLDNLKAAINLDAGAGTLYGSLTAANAFVVATTKTSTTLKVVCKVPGAIGNFVTTTEGSTHLAWGAAVLASGAGSVSLSIDEIVSVMGPQLNAEVRQALRDLDSDSTAR